MEIYQCEMLSEVFIKLAVIVLNDLMVGTLRLWACTGTAATIEDLFTDSIFQEGERKMRSWFSLLRK